MSDPHSTTYAVLGLLTFGPMSRYDAAQLAERTVGNFWNIAKSQVYGELRRCEELGWVTGEEVRQPTLPDKTVYHLTPSGKQALKTWLDSEGIEPDRLRSELLLRVFFASNMSVKRLEQLLDGYANACAQSAKELEGVTRFLQDPKYRYQRATALLGMKVSQAAVEWAEEVRQTLVTKKGRKS